MTDDEASSWIGVVVMLGVDEPPVVKLEGIIVESFDEELPEIVLGSAVLPVVEVEMDAEFVEAGPESLESLSVASKDD